MSDILQFIVGGIVGIAIGCALIVAVNALLLRLDDEPETDTLHTSTRSKEVF